MNTTGKVCPKCHIELRCKKNGVYGIEMASFGPSALWAADLWHCPDCGMEVLLGFGKQPQAEHYEEDFDEQIRQIEQSAQLKGIRFWMNGLERDEAAMAEVEASK